MSRLPDPYVESERPSGAARRSRDTRARPQPREVVYQPERPSLRLLSDTPKTAETTTVRRTANVVLAGIGLTVLLPIMALIALAVRLTSRGPVIYVQPRIGVDRRNGGRSTVGDQRRVDLGGKPFDILKFRTMYHRSGPRSRQVWTRPNDRRITPVGKFLRAYRLDELPQLVNVLRGEMNVVGPRPEQPEIFARLREQYERFPDRQRVLPGITGLAQVRCGYGGTTEQVERKLECDLVYVEDCSTRLDLKILAWTVPVVVTRRGAR